MGQIKDLYMECKWQMHVDFIKRAENRKVPTLDYIVGSGYLPIVLEIAKRGRCRMNHSLGQVNSRDYRVYNPDKRERRKEENESLKDLKELENLLKEKDRSISDISKEMNITAARAKSMITSLSTLEGSKLFDYKKKVPNNKKGIIMYSWLS
jgi:hypothetical protein